MRISMKIKNFPAVMLMVMLFASMSRAETVIYDASQIAPFKGRTEEEVNAEYQKARKAGTSYVNDDVYSWYEVMPRNASAPYEAGKLTEDTHTAMTAMNDFYRWLSGVEASSYHSEHSDQLQAGALIRNFDFSHSVSAANKPDDMSQELWDYGAAAAHNILATGIQLTPIEAISTWLEEGYNLQKGEWSSALYGGALGHRLALISGYNSGVQFGHSVRVAIGLVKGSGNYFKGAFSAYPSPGPMPRRKIWPLNSSWHVQLNDQVLFISDDNDLRVTVTQLSSGQSYECTKANGKIGMGSSRVINFAQPSWYDEDRYYSGKFSVNISGLYEKDTGSSAEINYTVNFMELPPEISAPIPKSVEVDSTYYTIYLSAEGSTPQTWSVTGGSLPNGMNIGTKGNEWVIQGKPDTEGIYTFTLNVSNKDGEESRQYTITATMTSPEIYTTQEVFSRIPASVDVSYSNSINAHGSKPMKYSIIDGSLPEGLTLSDDGRIEGIPEKEGIYSFTVKVENDKGTDTGTFTITVKRTKPVITTERLYSSISAGVQHAIYVYSKGSLPIRWSCSGGEMPSGMSIESDEQRPSAAVITGRPVKAGEYTFTLKAENDQGFDTRSFTLRVIGAVEPENTPTDNVNPVAPENTPTDNVNPVAPENTPTDNVNPVAPENTPTDNINPVAPENTPTDNVNPVTPENTPTDNVNPVTPENTPTDNVNPVTPENTPTDNVNPVAPDDTNTPGNSVFNPDYIRAMLGRNSSVPVNELSVSVNRHEADYYEAAAVLSEIRVSTTGIYLIENIPLSYSVQPGAYLYWHHSVNELYYEDNADCIFLDNSGRKINSPITSSVSSVNAAVYLEAGKYYKPAITAYYYDDTRGVYDQEDHRRDPNDGGRGESKGGGGCNYGFAGLSAAVLAIFIKRTSKQ